MKEWFRVRKSDDRVKGWHRSGKATSVPDDTAEIRHVECNATEIGTYESLQQQAIADGREGYVEYPESGSLQLPTDTRAWVRVETSKSEIDADGVDSMTLTFTKLISGTANTDTSFNQTVNVEFIERLIKLEFTSGVATKTFKTSKSGTYTFASTPKYKLESPLTITAVD